MNLQFNQIILHNFLSFGHSTINLNTGGYTLVTGVNQNPTDNAKSNGSGKSSIWDAICWCLTGETMRGTKDIVNIHGEDGCYVELLFDVNNQHYQLIRSKEHKEYKTNLKIYVNGEDKSGKGIKESNRVLEELLPDITGQLLGNVILFGQGLPMKFSSNSPSGRKEVLEKLSKSDYMIDDLKAKVDARKSRLKQDLRTVQDAMTSFKANIQMLEKMIADDTLALANCVLPENIYDRLSELQEQLAHDNEYLLQLDCILVKLDEDYKNVLDTYTKVNSNYQKDLGIAQHKNDEQINTLRLCITQHNMEITSLQKEITQLENIKDVCPTCGQKIPNVIKPSTALQHQQIDELSIKCENLTVQINNLKDDANNAYKAVADNYKTQLDNLQKQTQKIQTDITNTKTHRNGIDLGIRNALIEKEQTQKILDTFEVNKTNLQTRITDNTNNIESLKNNLTNETAKETNILARLDVVTKFETALKRDFRGYLLTGVIDYINKKAKQYAIDIFDNDKINFTLDGNNINISFDDKEYSCLSTGERQKVDLLVQFSLREMLCKYLNFDSNILVLDEIFDGLDAQGCNKVVDLISKMNNVNNVYIVTHRADLSLPVDKELIVVKNSNGISDVQ